MDVAIFHQVQCLIALNHRNTIRNLGRFLQYICEALDNRFQVNTIYIDFAKAFDRVNSNIFLTKIDTMEFNVNLSSLLVRSNLKTRTQ